MIRFLPSGLPLLTSVLQPNTIGLALYDNPMGQLAWIAEKFILCEKFALIFGWQF
jgi:hypothetical protein